MSGSASSPEIDFDRLSHFLKALANPNRLELLYQLRFPHTAGEIALTPKRSEAEGNPDRLISRQAVERHIALLETIGVVRSQKSTRDGRPVDEYVVNHLNLFAIVEEMRKLTLIKAHTPVDALATTAGQPVAHAGAVERGPRLILVSGVWEGRAYPMKPDAAGAGKWRVGRKEGLEVRLDYDPFISNENSEVVFEGGKYWLHDVPGSRNGTALNYDPLPKGGKAQLEAGDIIGVGRSLLVFKER